MMDDGGGKMVERRTYRSNLAIPSTKSGLIGKQGFVL
jgi:hypothetical protein